MVSASNIALVVDLDGTLTPTDTLGESIVRLIKQSPLNLFRLAIWLLKGRAGFKESIAAHGVIAVEHLPYRDALLSFLRDEKSKGRQIVLATAAHTSIANAVATHLALFNAVIATEGGRNLKGAAKLKAIQDTIGPDFVYAGDSAADLPIWKSSTAAILVGVNDRVTAEVRRTIPIEREFPCERARTSEWLRALRVYQWSKNLLLFVPLVTAYSFFEPQKLIAILTTFLAFSLAASATYILNDLLDLDSDRSHPRKRLRPFAGAKLPIVHGLAVATGALLVSLVLAYWVSFGVLFMLLLYVALTSAYSWALKEYVLIDVLMLSILYTLRILAGSVAIEVETSSWLLVFSIFIFFSLALVKRCAELRAYEQNRTATATRGRDYRVSDLVVLWPLGAGAALSAVVVFGLFVSAPDTQSRYATPQLLWLTAIGLLYWLARLWVKTSRGEMHDDPIIYAIKDRGSRITVLLMLAVMVTARFLQVDISH